MREHGAFTVNGRQVGTTLQCPHCGGHFLSVPGSRARRTWCCRCAAVTCGNSACDACVPHEARLEAREGRKTLYDTAIQELLASGATLL